MNRNVKIFSPTFRRFLGYAKPYRVLVLGAIGMGILKFNLALLLPWSLGHVIDHVLPHIQETGSLQQLWNILGLLTVAFIIRGFATYFRSLWSERASNRVVLDIRRDLLHHLQRLGLPYHHNRRTGQTTSRLINDLNQAEGVLDRGLVAITMDTIFLLVTTVLLFVYDWRLALVSMITLPFYGLTFRVMNPRLRALASQVQEELEELSGEVTEKLGGMQVVNAFVRERSEALRFYQRLRTHHAKVLKRIKVRMGLTSIAEFLQSFGPIIVIFYGGYLVATDANLAIGEFVTFYGFLSHLYLPTRRLADYSADVAERLAALDRVFDVFDQLPTVRDNPGAKRLQDGAGRVEFDNVTFGYAPGKPVLQNVAFTAEPGQSIALVGRSGAGKTTVINLVPRFYDVFEGAVRIDGHDVRDLTVASLRSKIGMVLQDPILFSGTIRDNILYGRRDATEDEMLRAARMAHADEFVSLMPDGYDTRIGERGITLSGGQKQRISIARAFLRDPRILILDEATSNLDSGAEAVIQEALKELMQGRTTLVIAHRLSTIIDCDRVVVLDQGRVAETGPHADLIQRNGLYRQLCEEQFGGIQLQDVQQKAG